MSKSFTRRQFVQNAGLGSLAIGLSPAYIKAQANASMNTVRIGIIGTGFRGQSHLEMLCQRKDTTIIAFADPDPRMLADAQKILKDAGRPAAIEYSKGNENYKQLLQRDDIDAVIIATPWE